MNWSWWSYLSGVATPFILLAVAALVETIIKATPRLMETDTAECALCHRTVGRKKPRILLTTLYRLHRLTPTHRKAVREWWQGGPQTNGTGTRIPAAFDRNGHPTSINGRQVHARWNNGVYLLDDRLIRVGRWTRTGDRMTVGDGGVTVIRIGDILVCTMRRIGRYAAMQVESGNGTVIRIASPRWTHWRLMPNHGKDWWRHVSAAITEREKAVMAENGGGKE